jgi:hypothetical protein
MASYRDSFIFLVDPDEEVAQSNKKFWEGKIARFPSTEA